MIDIRMVALMIVVVGTGSAPGCGAADGEMPRSSQEAPRPVEHRVQTEPKAVQVHLTQPGPRQPPATSEDPGHVPSQVRIIDSDHGSSSATVGSAGAALGASAKDDPAAPSVSSEDPDLNARLDDLAEVIRLLDLLVRQSMEMSEHLLHLRLRSNSAGETIAEESADSAHRAG